MHNKTPYLSIVIAGRNDNYGGNFNQRIERSINWLSFHIEKHQLSTELIIVNYNPIIGEKPLSKLINWPKNNNYLTIKIITVPEDIHNSFENESIRKKVPLYEFIAKNIGIRRANGEYILATNADIIFDPEIIKTISQRSLNKNYFYRADRCDFKQLNYKKVTSDKESLKTLESIKKNVYIGFLKGHQLKFNIPFLLFSKQLKALRRINKFKLNYNLFKVKYKKCLT
ncbi:MAG: glycosyltransferase family 2 protein [Flavobacteriales bacterium]|nr:glycosyltransferase family 2 protein [Flavobacteriales bacterium]